MKVVSKMAASKNPLPNEKLKGKFSFFFLIFPLVSVDSLPSKICCGLVYGIVGCECFVMSVIFVIFVNPVSRQLNHGFPRLFEIANKSKPKRKERGRRR